MIPVRALPASDYIPRVLPPHWKVVDAFGDGYVYLTRDGLKIIVSTADMEDGREWMHVSVSRKDRLPCWDELKHVKEVLIGNDRWAAQLLPPQDRYVNIHHFCLHLWSPLTGSLPWPDWGKEGTI